MRSNIGLYSFWMRTFAVAALVLLAAGCAAAPGDQVDMTLRNDTPVAFVVEVSTALGSRTVVVPPGTSWSGRVDKRAVVGPVQAIVRLPAVK